MKAVTDRNAGQEEQAVGAREIRVMRGSSGHAHGGTIANEFAEADSEQYRSALIALGFVLFIVTFIVLSIARLMLRRLSRKEGV